MSKAAATNGPLVDIQAIILSYNAGRGVLLVKHRSSKSLEDTLARYFDAPDRRETWFASFNWTSIELSDREQLQSLQKASGTRLVPNPEATSKRQAKRRIQRPATIGDVLCGMRVSCTLSRNPAWSASSISIDFESPRLDVPLALRMQPQQQWPEKPDRHAKRLGGINATGETNIHKPWRG